MTCVCINIQLAGMKENIHYPIRYSVAYCLLFYYLCDLSKGDY